MGPGVNDPLAAVEGPAAEGEAPADQVAIESRLRLYLGAIGVQAPEEVDRLAKQIMERVALRARVGQLGEPLEAAIEETHFLLDQWLLAEFGIDNDPDLLAAVRAAVLGGKVPGWTARWAGLSDSPLAEFIPEIWFPAVPERAPLVMEPNPIELCCHRLLAHLWAGIQRLFGRRQGIRGAHP